MGIEYLMINYRCFAISSAWILTSGSIMASKVTHRTTRRGMTRRIRKMMTMATRILAIPGKILSNIAIPYLVVGSPS